ncbi:PucR family transcriptional regulator [Rummeliibacillus suwonensis]|uniref:PucR family transcriptional regulator n=1 Tax=Rummeliibacillus suwonensis TaxID=1306154 RepID=UPI00289E3090|nr:PucR family transcriptional regulator ligand-binding domain-containing protein [Rummeliibacillus suwonensis]
MITFQHFLDSPLFYMLNLRGGEDGLNHEITGINVIESVDISKFCQANEIIISTGIHFNGDTKALLELITVLAKKRTAGLIINIGPYIPEVPAAAIALADQLQFPIFEMEWRYRIADLLRLTFHFLNTHHERKMDQEDLMRKLLLTDAQDSSLDKSLEQFGFAKEDEKGIILCTPYSSDHNIKPYANIIHQAFSARYKVFLQLVDNNQLIYLISRSHVQTPDIPFSRTVNAIFDKLLEKFSNAPVPLSIGMGNFYTEAKDLQKSLDEARTVTKLSQQHGNPNLYKYKEIGAYKIIMGVENRQLIQRFYRDMLGSLVQYDQIHNTNFKNFLRIFIEEDGSTSRISQREFIHRNTVLYKVKKIETLLDTDLSTPFTKTNLTIAFMIEDILSK